jgi:hypothetical protein
MAVVIGIVTGVLTGVGASAIFWWWQAQLMKPKIILCPTLAKYVRPFDNATRYQFKIINKRRRAAANIRITVSAVFPGLIYETSTETIRIQDFDLHWFKGHAHRLFRVQPSRMKVESREAYLKYLPSHIAVAISNGDNVDLADFLNLRPNSRIQVDVSATDPIAGAISHVQCNYTAKEIRIGRFRKGISCEHTGIFETGAPTEEDSNALENIAGTGSASPADPAAD